MNPSNNVQGWGRLMPTLIFLLVQFGLLAQNKESNVYQEFNVEIKGDYRYFFKAGAYPGQFRNYPSIAIEPEYFLEWADGKQSLQFTGFARLDRDPQRTHWDIRELYYQLVRDKWELSLGAKKIFWGVTESAHLVDIINQTDAVESFDGEQKLGQPMLHFSYTSGLGTFDFFGMPYFRQRQFPGLEGRLRTPFLLTNEDLGFESSGKEWHPDFAFQWSNYIGNFDYGLSYFYGTGREPIFQINPQDQSFRAFYPINHQIGLTTQAITGPWIWKLESMLRTNDYQDMFALAAGLEYTISNIKSSGIDLGILAEYLYDNRDEMALSGLDNDLFVGSRLAFNDVQSTEILLGGIFDLEKTTKLFSVEGSRRFGESWKVSLEARILSDVAPEEFLYFLRDDSFLKLEISTFF